MLTATDIIRLLDLKPLAIEGGYYRETYRSDETVPAAALPGRYGVLKSFSTAIYYLLIPKTYSVIHRVPSEEVFHFYLGDPVTMLHLHPAGEGRVLTLGHDLEKDHLPQVVVPRNIWQGCRLKAGGCFALMGTTVAPGFDFPDFEVGERSTLLQAYPDYADLIRRLTPGDTAARDSAV
ncbi:cupin domain-containing protein [bacterium]|nr:cupin domain-containing protein [bacterium]